MLLTQAGLLGPADEPTVSGVVADAEDRPVEGASLALSCGVMPDGSVPVLARAMSDGEGRFRLKWPGVDALRAANAYQVTVWAYRDGALTMLGLPRATEPPVAEVQIKFHET